MASPSRRNPGDGPMKKTGNGASRWRVAAVAVALLVLCAAGCATRRAVRVVDENGSPVPDALVVFGERNISPWPPGSGAGFADSAGECAFKARGFVEVEAFGPSSGWGRVGLAGNYPTGTLVLAPPPYEPYMGVVARRYLAGTPDVSAAVRRRLEAVLRQEGDEADATGGHRQGRAGNE